METEMKALLIFEKEVQKNWADIEDTEWITKEKVHKYYKLLPFGNRYKIIPDPASPKWLIDFFDKCFSNVENDLKQLLNS